jgi:geranylgeranyl diphosphate synthase type II
MTMFDLAGYLARNSAAVESALSGFLEPSGRGQRLTEAMRYSLLAGGKRIRPTLCIAAAEAVGGAANQALAAACALEMIHTYSLIHDDLPAMDDDDLRRGQPTCHKAFDEATAILAGDALLTLAFEVLAGMEAGSPLVKLELIRRIAAAAGFRGMVLGQVLDIGFEGRSLGLEEVEFLHGRKTGDMIEAALVTGALIAGGSEEQLQRIGSYGRSVGLAFQVVDDILNVEGDPAVMGKAAGTDQLRRKNSYPELLGLAKSKEFAQNLKRKAIAALAEFDTRADPLRAIAAYIVQRKK